MMYDNEKLDYIRDYITIDRNACMHKQVERRNGILFMRMKKRILRMKS